MEPNSKLMSWKLLIKMGLFQQCLFILISCYPFTFSKSANILASYKILTSKGWICRKCKGFPFLNNSKCIWDLNKVNNFHNYHGLKRVTQGRVINRVERVPFWKSRTSPWGCVLQSDHLPGHTCSYPTLFNLAQKTVVKQNNNSMNCSLHCMNDGDGAFRIIFA